MPVRIGMMIILAAMLSCAFAEKPKLVVTSSAFMNNAAIPTQYTCEGNGGAPPLKISNIPPGTQSLALIVHDPDAPVKGGFTHWVMWNIPVQEDIPEHYNSAPQGQNSGKQAGYAAPCPPTGTHHYHFTIYALDRRLDLTDQADKKALEKAMKGHILASGTLTGMYKKIKS